MHHLYQQGRGTDLYLYGGEPSESGIRCGRVMAYDGDGNRIFQLNYNLHTDNDWKGNSGNGNGNNNSSPNERVYLILMRGYLDNQINFNTNNMKVLNTFILFVLPTERQPNGECYENTSNILY